MPYWDTAGASDEWYTPAYIFAALGCRFDLDVTPARYGTAEGALAWIEAQNAAGAEAYRRALADYDALPEERRAIRTAPPPFIPRPIPANLVGSDHVPADRRLEGDSLEQDWGSGFVWMNPPFGGRNGLTPWLDKFFAHGDGIALTPDRTSAPWYWEAWAHAELVLHPRKIRFLRPDGTEGVSPSNGTTLWAIGARGRAALEEGNRAGLGILGVPRRVPSAAA